MTRWKLIAVLFVLLVGVCVMVAQDESAGAFYRTVMYGRRGWTTGTEAKYDELRNNRLAGLMVSDPYQFASSLNRSYFVTNKVTNPTAGHDLLNALADSSFSASQVFEIREVTISSTVAGEFQILQAQTAGSTCSSLTALGTRIGNYPGPGSLTHTCTTDPGTLGGGISLFVPANGSVTYVFGNWWTPIPNFGISVKSPAALTGTVSVIVSYNVGGSKGGLP